MADATQGVDEVGAPVEAAADAGSKTAADKAEANPDVARGEALKVDAAAQSTPPRDLMPFAAKARDLEELRKAVVDAAGVSAGLWISYLFVFFYLAIATGGVTHRDLLLENPIKLPFLSVELPLVGFFVLGPLLFLIVHAYVLLHFVLLAGKVGAFDAELRNQIDDRNVRARLRRQLPNNIFVQFLAGPREVRTGIIGFMLRLIAWISLVAGPLALLLFFLFQFLPYHRESIAWWQRLLIFADLAILWTLWPSIARGKTIWLWRYLGRRKIRRRIIPVAVISLAPLLLAFTIATFPGELLDRKLPAVRFVPTKWPMSKSGPGQTDRMVPARSDDKEERGKPKDDSVAPKGWTSLHELLFAGDVDLISRKATSLWSNRLVVPGVDVNDRVKLKLNTEGDISITSEAFSLRGRQLEGAVLIDARLRKTDFSAAQLQDAVLDRADLREAKFECAPAELAAPEKPSADTSRDERPATTRRAEDLSPAVPDRCAQMQRASLVGARLRDAVLVRADLRNAKFNEADLQGAQLQDGNLDDAQLKGANLDNANFLRARLTNAQLTGASLEGTNLQGASLEDSRLRGAWLKLAQLQNATLSYAWLDGAWLDSANLQGADLGHTELRSAWLVNTDLQGANLGRVGLENALVDGALAWRANINPEGDEDALVRVPKSIPTGDFGAVKRQTDSKMSTADDEEIAKTWIRLEEKSPSSELYQDKVAGRLKELGCESDGAPYVIHGLLRQLVRRFDRPQQDSLHPAALAAAFLDEATCPGARGLSDDDRIALQKIGGRPPVPPTSATTDRAPRPAPSAPPPRPAPAPQPQ
jgi:uncharacterized protein YjbI with pentapeptide repeats